MPVPVGVTIENCSRTVASNGLMPLDGAVQWSEPPVGITWARGYTLTGENVVGPLTAYAVDLGAKGTFPATIGSMATQTTARVHVQGVTLDPGERVTGTLVSESATATEFSAAGDGLAFLSSVLPTVEFGSTVITPTRTTLRDWNVLREVQELDGRNATYGLYHRWRLYFWPNTKRVGWVLDLSFTDERLSDRVLAWPRVRLRVPITWRVHVQDSVRCFGSASYDGAAYRFWDLIAPHTIHDAQTARFRGTFLLPSATAADLAQWLVMPNYSKEVPRILCDPEEYRGKLYYYGGLPKRHPDFDTNSCRDRYERFLAQSEDRGATRNDYTRDFYDLGMHRRPQDGGSQPDFAGGPFYELFCREGGNPLKLPEIDAAGDRMMSRPITYRRKGLDDADPLAARIVLWGDYLAEDFVLDSQFLLMAVIQTETDVRGKSTLGANRAPRYFGGMEGLQRSHISFWHAIEAMFLTGSFEAEDIVRQMTELGLYEWIANPNYYHAQALQMRYSRWMDNLCWAHFLTGDARIPERLNQLATISESVWRDYSTHVALDHPWKTFGSNNTNDVTNFVNNEIRRMQGVTHDSWQASLSQGYYRAYQCTGNEFYLTLFKNVTAAWITNYRFGSYRYFRNSSGWNVSSTRWHSFFKMFYPGRNVGYGTEGEFPPASWFTPENEYILWVAFEDNVWMPQAMALAISVHTDADLLAKARAIFAQEFESWFASSNLSLVNDTLGEWFGDDALIDDPSGNIEIRFPPEESETIEPDFDVEGGASLIRIERGAEETVAIEPGFTITQGDVLITIDEELSESIEPPFTIDDGSAYHFLADPEETADIEPPFTVRTNLSLSFTAESTVASEPSITVSDLTFAAESTVDSEPGFSLYDGESRPVAKVRAVSGTSVVAAKSGTTKIRAEGTA